jgi:hypothetical protein
MQKTGESYSAARAQLLKKPLTPSPVTYAARAGMMSDAALKAKTGCTWERWVHALDRVEAHTWTHRAIAQYVAAKYKTPSWWAQTVTVGYERIRGLRAIGQRRDGTFEATKSKTVPVPVSRLYRAFSDKRTRSRWLPEVDLRIRTATPGKVTRMTWHDGTSVVAGFTAKGAAKSQVQVQHEKLPSQAAATHMKRYWGERLEVLVELLTAATPGQR